MCSLTLVSSSACRGSFHSPVAASDHSATSISTSPVSNGLSSSTPSETGLARTQPASPAGMRIHANSSAGNDRAPRTSEPSKGRGYAAAFTAAFAFKGTLEAGQFVDAGAAARGVAGT
jgi:hypothetical protein